MKIFAKSVLMLAVVAACVSFASCGNAGAEKAKADSIAMADSIAKADSIAAAEAAAAAAAAAADTTAVDSTAVAK